MRNDMEFCFYGRKFDDSHAGTLEDDDAAPPSVVKLEGNTDTVDVSMSQDTQDGMNAPNVPKIEISNESMPMDIDSEPKSTKTVGEDTHTVSRF